MIGQLTFLHDLIEINGGKCVKLSSRCIVKTLLEASDIGKVSPRIYCDFIPLKEQVEMVDTSAILY